MSNKIKPHPLNTSDGFYVEADCCTACDVPNSEAPDLFAYDDDFRWYSERDWKNNGKHQRQPW